MAWIGQRGQDNWRRDSLDIAAGIRQSEETRDRTEKKGPREKYGQNVTAVKVKSTQERQLGKEKEDR
jgi:hypothetical protein